MPTNPLLNSTAVSESIDQISELYGLNWRSKVALKNGEKYFVPTTPLLNSTAVSKSIEPNSELYGLN